MPSCGQLTSVLDVLKANLGDFIALIPLGEVFPKSQVILSWKGPIRTIKSSSCTDHPQESRPVPKGVVQTLLDGLSGQEQFIPKEIFGNSFSPRLPLPSSQVPSSQLEFPALTSPWRSPRAGDGD